MTVTDWKALNGALQEAEKPLFIFGGNDWTAEGARAFSRWLEETDLRVFVGTVPGGGQARMSTLMAHLVPTLPADAMVTPGAGEHTN